MARSVQVRAEDHLAARIKRLVEGTRLTFRGFEKPGSQRAPERVAADQRRLYEDADSVKMIERIMEFYTAHPIDEAVLKTHDTYWFRQTYTRTDNKAATLGAVIVALLLLGYTLRGDRHEKTEHAAFYAPGARSAKAVPIEELVSWGEYKDTAVKKAEQRRKRKERDEAALLLEAKLKERARLDAEIRELHRKVNGKDPSQAVMLDDALSEQYLMRTHWDMVWAQVFGNRDGLAHLDAWLCKNAKDRVPQSESARQGWMVTVPAPHVAADALGKDASNVRKLYRALEELGRMEIEGNFRVSRLVTWRVGHERYQRTLSAKEFSKLSAKPVPVAVEVDDAVAESGTVAW